MICSHGLPQCLSSWRCMKSSLKHGKYPTCLSSFLLTTLDGLTAKGMWMFPRWSAVHLCSQNAATWRNPPWLLSKAFYLTSALASKAHSAVGQVPAPAIHDNPSGTLVVPLMMLVRSLGMVTQKHILLWIWPQDCFAVINLKDMYFHVSILLQHRPFLWTIISVWSNPLWVTTGQFTEVSAFVLLQEVWIWILNYFNDWLILAYSQDLLCKHRELVLRYFSHLGL